MNYGQPLKRKRMKKPARYILIMGNLFQSQSKNFRPLDGVKGLSSGLYVSQEIISERKYSVTVNINRPSINSISKLKNYGRNC